MLSMLFQVNHYSKLNDCKIIYDRKIGDIFYLDFSVINLQANQTQFLSLYNRQLKAASTIMNWKDRLSHIYIKHKYQNFHLVTASGKITEVVFRFDMVVG